MISLIKEIGLWTVAFIGGLLIVAPVMVADAPAWYSLVVIALATLGFVMMSASLPRTSLYRKFSKQA